MQRRLQTYLSGLWRKEFEREDGLSRSLRFRQLVSDMHLKELFSDTINWERSFRLVHPGWTVVWTV